MSFQHFLLPGQLVKIPPVWVFSIFSACGLAFEHSAGVSLESFQHFLSLFNISCLRASFWGFRQRAFLRQISRRVMVLEASPSAQRMLHGKLLWSCNCHNLAKICGRGLQCLTCYIVTITLTFQLSTCEDLAHWSVLPKSHSGLWERIKRTKEINAKNLWTYFLHAKLSTQPQFSSYKMWGFLHIDQCAADAAKHCRRFVNLEQASP